MEINLLLTRDLQYILIQQYIDTTNKYAIELKLFIINYNFMIACNYYIIVFMYVCEIIKISLFGAIKHVVPGSVTLVAEDGL